MALRVETSMGLIPRSGEFSALASSYPQHFPHLQLLTLQSQALSTKGCVADVMDIERSKSLVGAKVEELRAYTTVGGGSKRACFGGRTCTSFAVDCGTLRPDKFRWKMFLSEWIACRRTSVCRAS